MTHCKQHTAVVTLVVDGMYRNGMRVVSEETQDSVNESVTISPVCYQLQSINLSASKSRIQRNAKQLFHCQFPCVKQENEDERGPSPNSICNVAQPCIKNVLCTRCTPFLINLFQLNYPLHVSNK
jgi:hypothetical protein